MISWGSGSDARCKLGSIWLGIFRVIRGRGSETHQGGRSTGGLKIPTSVKAKETLIAVVGLTLTLTLTLTILGLHGGIGSLRESFFGPFIHLRV